MQTLIVNDASVACARTGHRCGMFSSWQVLHVRQSQSRCRLSLLCFFECLFECLRLPAPASSSLDSCLRPPCDLLCLCLCLRLPAPASSPLDLRLGLRSPESLPLEEDDEPELPAGGASAALAVGCAPAPRGAAEPPAAGPVRHTSARVRSPPSKLTPPYASRAGPPDPPARAPTPAPPSAASSPSPPPRSRRPTSDGSSSERSAASRGSSPSAWRIMASSCRLTSSRSSLSVSISSSSPSVPFLLYQ
mmetsp:Transcript_24839/g.62873  ORF Transcript_24839/g.62873 Transcript_24839/m.62873 type:complete len:248 (+) Transcript_24839:78-821(+)